MSNSLFPKAEFWRTALKSPLNNGLATKLIIELRLKGIAHFYQNTPNQYLTNKKRLPYNLRQPLFVF